MSRPLPDHAAGGKTEPDEETYCLLNSRNACPVIVSAAISPPAFKPLAALCYGVAVERHAGTTLPAHEAAERVARLLSADTRVQLVYLFGSAADATRAQVRDLDIAVLADPPLGLDERLRLRADLVAATGLDVDLVPLAEAPVVLAHEIAETGLRLFARTPEQETEFVTRARSRYWDFKPFLDEQWRLTGERLRERRRDGVD